MSKGGSYEITLPAENGYDWEAVNRKTLAALSSDTQMTKKDNGEFRKQLYHEGFGVDGNA